MTRCVATLLIGLTLLVLSSAGCSGGGRAASATSAPLAASVATLTQDPIPPSIPASTSNLPGIAWNGSSRFLLGNNYAWHNYGTDFGTGGWGDITNFSTVSADFQAMASQCVRVTRWWVFADGRYVPSFANDGMVSGLDPAVFTHLDRALEIASNNNVYLILTLVDFPMWANETTLNGVKMGGHAAMITNPAVQQSYLDNALTPFLQHVAASPHKKMVLAYDIVNEPEGQMSIGWGGDAQLATAPVQSFVRRCAETIHTHGGGAYATLGCAKAEWISLWKGLGLDFYQIHYYRQHDGGAPGSALPPCASLTLDKPCIVGEYDTSCVSYGLSDTSYGSAKGYLDTIQKQGYAGSLGWSYVSADAFSNWASFHPVFTSWAQTHGTEVGPP